MAKKIEKFIIFPNEDRVDKRRVIKDYLHESVSIAVGTRQLVMQIRTLFEDLIVNAL